MIALNWNSNFPEVAGILQLIVMLMSTMTYLIHNIIIIFKNV